MSYRRIRYLVDVLNAGLVVRVVCGRSGCDHSALFDPMTLRMWMRRGSTELAALGHHFVCDKCGHRGATLEPHDYWSEPKRSPPRPLGK